MNTRSKRVYQGAIGFSLHLIGWEGGASFLDQSNSTVKQNQFNPGLPSTLNWKLLYRRDFRKRAKLRRTNL